MYVVNLTHNLFSVSTIVTMGPKRKRNPKAHSVISEQTPRKKKTKAQAPALPIDYDLLADAIIKRQCSFARH